MRRSSLLLAAVLTAALPLCLAACEDEQTAEAGDEVEDAEERTPGPGEVQPPVPYEVAETKTAYGVERGVSIDIVVEPGVYADELEELFAWFKEVWYSDRSLIHVDVYDSHDAAASLNQEVNRLLATYRFTAPGHTDVVIYVERLVPGEGRREEEEFRSGTHSVYLGPKSRMFSSQQQAQYMQKMMEDQPAKQVYEVSWLSNDSKIVLTFDVLGQTLVRVREGFGREIWSNYNADRLEQAAMGGGFGGQAVHGGDYIRLDETSAVER